MLTVNESTSNKKNTATATLTSDGNRKNAKPTKSQFIGAAHSLKESGRISIPLTANVSYERKVGNYHAIK